LLALVGIFALGLGMPSADAYSVLSHEEVVDMAWKAQIVPLLKQRYPAISADELRQAHAYAYGGSVIQDIGYYPFGSHYFSDLLHYVRPNEFVAALIRDSKSPDEYAFALGALAHFCGDTVGHPVINEVTAEENPPLKRRFGQTVTYAEDPTAHLRTEFGFDVVEMAQGHYSQSDYRDFVGFQVSKTLLEQAFRETYGLEVSSIIPHEDLAIASYRKAVSTLIPQMTKVAFVSYRDQIQKAQPGVEKAKFIYRLNKTEYRLEFGTEHMHVGFGGRVLAVFLHVVPKVGPFKALKLKLPNAQEQVLCLKSVNDAVDQYRIYLAQVSASPMAVPPPSEQDVAAAKDAASKVTKDAKTVSNDAAKAKDPEVKARLDASAAKVQATAEKVDAAAARTEEKADAATSAQVQRVAEVAAVSPPPTAPVLPELDMDTGKPAGVGEYPLADEAYAHLLGDLVKTTAVNPELAADVEGFFARTQPATGVTVHPKDAEKRDALMQGIPANLVKLRAMTSTTAAKPEVATLTR
jgi:hypothetical protein